MLAVFLLSAFLLSSIAAMPAIASKVLLLCAFAGMGILVFKSVFRAFLIFLFLFPLLPSVPHQIGLPDFDYSEFLFLCLAFWWSANKLMRRETRLPTNPFGIRLTGFLLVCLVSVLIAIYRENLIVSEIFLFKLTDYWNVFLPWNQFQDLTVLQAFVSLIESVILFFISIDLLTQEAKTIQAIRVLVASAVPVSLLGILQYFFKFRLMELWVRENPFITRVNSTFDDPNALGTFLACIFILGVSVFPAEDSRYRKAYLSGITFIGAALFFTASRAALGAVFLVLVFFPLVVHRTGFLWPAQKMRMTRAIKFVAAVSLAVFLGVILIAASVNYTNRKPPSVAELMLFTLNPNIPLDVRLKGRYGVWEKAATVAERYPLLGCGVGNLPRTARYFWPLDPSALAHQNAHSYFLQVLAETGVAGFVSFLILLFYAFRRSFHFLQENSRKPVSMYVYGVLSAILCVLLTCLTGHPLVLLKLQFLFWLLIAFLFCLIQHSFEEKKNQYPVLAGLLVLVAGLGFAQERFIAPYHDRLPYEYGYYEWEQNKGLNHFRWTQDRAVSQLRIQGEALKFTLCQDPLAIRGEPFQAEILLENQLVDTVTFFNSSCQTLKYYVIPGDFDQVHLEVRSSKVFVASGEKSRELGVAVSSFEWEKKLSEPAGFYGQESSHQGAFVWTRGQASIPLTKLGSKLIVPVNVMKTERTVEVEFYWNKTLCKTILLKEPGLNEVTLDLPSEASNQGVLTIRASDTWNPARPGLGGDTRDLGIILEAARWGDAKP